MVAGRATKTGWFLALRPALSLAVVGTEAKPQATAEGSPASHGEWFRIHVFARWAKTAMLAEWAGQHMPAHCAGYRWTISEAVHMAKNGVRHITGIPGRFRKPVGTADTTIHATSWDPRCKSGVLKATLAYWSKDALLDDIKRP